MFLKNKLRANRLTERRRESRYFLFLHFFTKGMFEKDNSERHRKERIDDCYCPHCTWLIGIGHQSLQQTKRTNDVMVLIKLAIIVLFIVCAVWYVKPSNWQPFSPYGIYTFQPGSTQPYGIVPAASIVFFSFIGFDAVSSSAEETINPSKTFPRALPPSVRK